MRRVVVLSLLVAFVSAASASTLYKWDDGSSENSVGLTAGGDLAWMNKFSVVGGDNVITSIHTTWGSPSFPGTSGVYVGAPFRYYVWSGIPNGAYSLLYQGNSTIAPGTIDTDVFQTVPVPNIAVPGSDFFIGISVVHAAGGYPAPLDQTSGYVSGRSWVAGSATTFDPNNIAGGIGLYDVGQLFPGYWLLRATAIPEPASLVLLGLAGLFLRRR